MAQTRTAKARIKEAAIQLLTQTPDGIRHSVLIRALTQSLPDISRGNIINTVTNLTSLAPDSVYKPSRGLLMSTRFRTTAPPPDSAPSKPASEGQVCEASFYEPLAAYLVNELEECTRAQALGGAKLKDKWGTPDVIGIRKPKGFDLYKFPAEIVSAEVKTDSNGLITAFGQAVAYKLFSHKSYVVVPIKSSPGDLERLEALCLICGLGLILFDHLNPSDPGFTLKLRAVRSEPDSYYVNENLKPVADLFE